MKVAIVKYNAGNVFSVVNALRRLGVEPVLTDDAAELRSADRVVFPGQGEASHAMSYLRSHGLDSVIVSLHQPLLGICIGQQLLCRHSEEGDADCLGIFDTEVKRFRPQTNEYKVPCMGWNSLSQPAARTMVDPLMRGILSEDGSKPYVYFIHSYYVPLCEHTIAVADYTLNYSAALHRDNFYATQFHPEKSGDVGERILRNFIELDY